MHLVHPSCFSLEIDQHKAKHAYSSRKLPARSRRKLAFCSSLKAVEDCLRSPGPGEPIRLFIAEDSSSSNISSSTPEVAAGGWAAPFAVFAAWERLPVGVSGA